MGLEEGLGDDDVGGDELVVRPQGLLVDQDLRAFGDQLGGGGLGDPGAVDLAGGVGGGGEGVVGADDGDVARAGLGVLLVALAREEVEQRHVLGVAGLRGGDLLALEVRDGLDGGGVDHEFGAAGGGSGDDLQGAALGLHVAVDRGGGADPGDVDGAGVEGLDLAGAGVEDLRGDLRAAQGLLEPAVLDADQRGRVGQVREVADVDGARRQRRAGGGRGGGAGGGVVRGGRGGLRTVAAGAEQPGGGHGGYAGQGGTSDPGGAGRAGAVRHGRSSSR